MKGFERPGWGVAVGLFFGALLVPVGFQLAEVTSGGHRVVVLALLAVYGLAYLALPMLLWGASLRVRLASVAFMIAVGVAVVVAVGLGTMLIMAYAMAVSAVTLPSRWAIGVCGTVVGGFGLAAVMSTEPWLFAPWAGLVSITAVQVLLGLLMRSNRALRRAQHELAAMAVAQERERVARDLHDVLGHTLTTLAVKAALVRRLLDRGMVDQALAEVADIEVGARGALGDVRATVSGVREASLAAEVAGARVALEAGRIEAKVSGDLDGVPVHLREAFAFVVREGVTNVIRHSGARSCSIHIGPSFVEVSDAGNGPAGDAAGVGHGLAGLRQRLEAVGGSLSAGPAPGGGFQVRAEVASAR